MRITKTLIGLSAVAMMVLALAAPSSAQTPPPNPQTQAQQPPPPTAQPAPAPGAQDRARQPMPSMIEGDLVSVDAEAKTLTVKPASGPEVKFSYNDATEISGSQKDAAGLATLREGKVTVHFKEDAQTRSKLATRIIVAPKQ